MNDKQQTFRDWLLPVLVSLLLVVAGANFFQNRNTQKAVETLQLQTAVLQNTVATHIDFGTAGMGVVNDNEKRLDLIEASYMKREEVLRQLELMRDYMDKTYVKK